MAAPLAPFVREDRLWDRHMAMARIGALGETGVNRAALSAEDIAARALLISWAEARGFAVAVDPIANLFLRRAGTDPDAPPVLTGSHMDSQPRGGRFDGIYGVLAALEALEALEDAGIATRRPVEAVAWTNEEGGRFQPGVMGSTVFAGKRRLEDMLDVRDAEGVRLADALAGTLAATPDAARRPLAAPFAAYVEAHIEQGPVLEASATPIGAVSGIQGIRWFEVRVTGETAHAGTTPIGLRRDALREAVAMMAAVHALAPDEEPTLRLTTGRALVEPNSPNTVAERVTFTVDLRHPDTNALEAAAARVEKAVRVAARRCSVEIATTVAVEPCTFDPGILARIEAAAAALGLGCRRLPSGASHDAHSLADLGPCGMIFVPCAHGISHNVAEYAAPADLAAGARVLAEVVRGLAEA